MTTAASPVAPGGARVVNCAVVNHTNDMPDQTGEIITRALNIQVAGAATQWGLTPVRFYYVGAQNVAKLPSDVVELGVFDNPTVANALGYHDVDPQGRPYGCVFRDPIIQNGGTDLSGSLSTSVTTSHEGLELTGDPAANRWALDSTGNLWALELCDQVQNDYYNLTVNGEPVSVSNYLLPEAFDPNSAGPYDEMGLCTKPFQIRPGGYALENGQQVFGPAPTNADEFAAREVKQLSKVLPQSRTSRRTESWHSRRNPGVA